MELAKEKQMKADEIVKESDCSCCMSVPANPDAKVKIVQQEDKQLINLTEENLMIEHTITHSVDVSMPHLTALDNIINEQISNEYLGAEDLIKALMSATVKFFMDNNLWPLGNSIALFVGGCYDGTFQAVDRTIFDGKLIYLRMPFPVITSLASQEDDPSHISTVDKVCYRVYKLTNGLRVAWYAGAQR